MTFPPAEAAIFSQALNRLHGRCLGQKLSTYLFNELRNKEHIGYVVDASFWPGDLKHNGVMIRIKSPVLNAEELRTRVLSALAEFDESCGSTDLRQSLSEIVQEMEEREFEHHWALQQLGLNSDRIPFLVSSMEKTARTNDRGAFSRHFKQALTQKPYIALYM
ncbi:hypothetical protein GNI_159680 [Gregarina niphandrodes]|uniref:Coenzyme PQQ synthesis protein F-like C-terminal lobe domain-containing protein n=1 Tax=Gregarina niphandrodes TaxID=110365 RepID=A0A023AYM6_GRENI|nr:hypothetical protein GNI_159680 [Gregarina niphandrodes]EZG43771.1 hypothetical protein GNI_159680 [Gregarina niphandrodes]|eukprot:XP_011134619.1 hypothetical protein GNI_159680 [Gregarina niphandrodes]